MWQATLSWVWRKTAGSEPRAMIDRHIPRSSPFIDLLSTTMVKLKLFVYVIGRNYLFPVEIQWSDTVGDLKDAILRKKPNNLKDIDAVELVLYKVELPNSNDLEGSVSQASKEELEDPLSELEDIFPVPPKKVISILVKVPSIGE